MKLNVFFLLLLILNIGYANEDSTFVKKIYNEALVKGEAYNNLRVLCKDIGARLTGSAEAAMAIEWAENLLESYAFDNVYLQEIKVPHWERGTKEAGWIINAEQKISKLDMLALGGSVGTGGLIEGEVIKVESIEELNQLSDQEVDGKIVFFNRPFDQKMINMFKAYGACVDQRWAGTSEASKKNAKAVVIRSLASNTDGHPHTGSMHYEDGVIQIPGAAISPNDADDLVEWLTKGKVTLRMEMDCKTFADVTSYNVIAEFKGSEDDKIITIGAHLDSWDVGEGAHDDGAGVVQCIEAFRILKKLGYRPNHTLRCVLFMNEENGNFGGKSYAEIAVENSEEHICAIETDRGGFLPMGFDVVGSDEQLEFIREITGDLKPYDLLKFNHGYGGVDIGPLRQYFPTMIQLGLNVNSQAYFDFHHSAADVFETVHQRELALGAAAMGAMLYLMDRNL
ncbi:M20/M25/M40 family metallo-hydrolase [Crocinitomix catalasitica]|uniref:M20/M25/M40 family metallo-hydrolase n=1 Tax=Crocinitomix catalasitica TaxID=184607 RepID=UPI000482BD54|nr:M20/M25/M40 family metallo-hydrolase [Crocinitomix catalasitica]